MMIWMRAIAVGLTVVTVTVFGFGGGAFAQEGVKSLRGDLAIEDEHPAAAIPRPNTGKLFSKNYRQQPPLIPHKIDKYEIDLKVNQCMGCHDWPQNVEARAPKISETHYVSPKGERLNKVSGSRWFCTQCHVPQAQLDALVPNTFESSADMR